MIEVKAGYKQTEVGVIPEDWEVKKLGDCLTRPPRYGIGAAAVEYSDQLPKYIRITDISETGRFIPEKKVSVDNLFSANYYLSEGDLVVARTGATVGKSYLYRPQDGPLVFAGFLICLSSNKNILLPDYLGSYVKTASYWSWVKLTSMRSGQPGINGNEYARLLIPLPKPEEQNAIATILSDTDALIEHLEKLIAKKRNIKQGTMQQLLTGKKRLPGFEIKKGYKQTEVGVVPDDWGTLSLKQITLDILQGVNTAIDKPEYVHDGIPMLKANNVIDGEVIFDGADHISRKTFSGYCNRFKARKNDFLFSNIGARLGTGSLLKLDVECSFAWNVMRIVPDTQKITPEYLCFLINSPKYSQNIKSKQSGSGMGFVPKGVMQNLVFAFPKRLEEQNAIATIISDMDAEIEALEQKRDKYTMLKQGMMQQLLTGRIRIHGTN